MTDKNEHKCVDKNELLDKTKLNIEKFGLQVIMVNSTGYSPSFSYSIAERDSIGGQWTRSKIENEEEV